MVFSINMVSPTSPKKSGIPEGEYRLVGWDLDTTGRRLIDDICQIAAYTPKQTFSQYVMPYKDLDVYSQKRHMIYTMTVGRYRMLKDRKSGKAIKTKSEISALLDFINWLEEVRNQEPACTGIILLCHETSELAPLLLLEALRRYNLIERFSSLVKGFANCYSFVKQKCESSVTVFSLRVLSKILLDKESEQTHNAADRARLAYQLVHHLCTGMGENTGAGDGTVSSKVIVEALSDFTSTIADEEKEIERFKEVLERQSTFRPVFGPLMKINLAERRRATSLRRVLVEALFDYDMLQTAWTEGNKENLSALLENKLSKVAENEREEILSILVNHFDPTKPFPLPPRRNSHPNNRRRSSKKSTSQSDNSSTPETTPTSSSPSKSFGNVTPVKDSPKHVNPVVSK